ncbi:MAG: c-type cytochrome [Elusimicrobia bacterium]|nr:c-type cytochrome [Elusimicrobiota bacterium]
MKRLVIPAALLLGALLALVLATRRDLTQPHLRLFNEMVKSPASKSQTDNAILPGGLTQQTPPAGTFPRGGTTFHYGPSLEERARAARELRNPMSPTLDNLERGKVSYSQYCLHCHGAKGRGDGGVAKSFPALSFSLAGKSSFDLPDGELFHILTYGRNNMPPHAAQLPMDERWRVVSYLRELQRTEIARLGPLAEIPEDPRRLHLVSESYGKELFAQNCSACHGAEGRAGVPGVPTLHLPSVLSMVDDDYYIDIITHGRKGSQMPAWEKTLTRTQMLSIIKHLRTWDNATPDRAAVLAQASDPKRGEAIFRGRCAACHGRNGQGGIGNTLNSPSFLSIASPQFFRDMVISGRKHTAMPASYNLSTGEIGDLVAYLGSWSRPRHSLAEVRDLLPAASAEIGAKIFSARCASCHGVQGEGGIGSRLNSDSFLRMADDEFLFNAVSKGRPGTAMPAWYFLPSRDVADLLKFMRTWQKSESVALNRPARRGEPEFGKLIFDKACIACHGPEGRGGVGGQIGNAVFLASAKDEFLWRTIAQGKQGTGMKGFLEGHSAGTLMSLNSSDIDHVVSYLRTLGSKPRVDLLDREFPGASADAGKEIFLGKGGCSKCHGQQGEGSSGPSLNALGFLKAASNGYLAATIIMGRQGTEMRAFGQAGNVTQLSQREVMDLVAYIRSWERNPPNTTRVIDRTESSAQEGAELFKRYCLACHGAEGRAQASTGTKGYAPSLNTPEFLHAADDGLLMATIALGRPNTAMRPFGAGAGGVAELSAADIRKIVAYMRSWENKK